MSQRWIAAIVTAACTSAAAQTFPDKAVRIVVPYPPGGRRTWSRAFSARSTIELLGQSIIIDNRSGAGGIVGTVAVARAAPDGYTLVACTVGTCAIVPSLVKNTGYDLAKDFVPVILFGGVANIFVVTPTFPPEEHQGTRRARKSASRRDRVRLGRRGQLAAHDSQAAQVPHEDRHGARAV